MKPQELRNSILQLAIQGKLVEQRPEEGTGEELYGKIQFVQIKNLKPISEDEIPFDIPQTWRWVRHNELFEIIGGSQPPKAKFISVPQNGYVRLYQTRDYGKNPIPVYVPTNSVSKFTKKGDILLARYGGSLGKVFWAEDGAYNVALARVSFLFSNNVVDKKYLFFYYLAPIYQTFVHAHSRSAQAGFNKEDLNSMLFPLPPLSEQKRIVAKIEELLPYVDRYEEAWKRLGELDKRFPGDLQKSVLQLAIQGKLVEQRPDEGTAEELYREIQREKQRLVKEGKIKKEKPLPEIKEDEIPFEIPDGWMWVRLGEIGSYKKGPFGSALTKNIFVPRGKDTIKVYEQKNAIQKNAELGDYYITREYFETKMKGFEVHPGDIIVSCAGTIGETFVLPEGIETGIINQALMRMYIYKPLYVSYFLLFFDFVLKKNARSSSKGSAIKNIPPFEVLKSYLVPLPPLTEQKRIVAKIEELLPLCERLTQINA